MFAHIVHDPKPGNKSLNLIGERFGQLVVEEFVGYNTGMNKLWKCKCDCGGSRVTYSTNLRKGLAKHCTSKFHRSGSRRYNYTGYQETTGSRWNAIVANSRSRNLEFTITKEYVWNMLLEQSSKCALSGLTISFLDSSASVDRINSKLGYTNDNIQLVHKDINMMKRIFTQDYFIDLCRLVSNKGLIGAQN